MTVLWVFLGFLGGMVAGVILTLHAMHKMIFSPFR